MTWLKGLPEGSNDWERLQKAMPSQLGALGGIHKAIWEVAPDPALLELCRLRMAEMLHCDAALKVRMPQAVAAGLSEDKALAVSQWPTSPLFSEKERHWLEFTEQFIGDVNGVTDELVESLLEYSSPEECSTMAVALWPIEQSLRATALLGLDQSPELNWASAQ